MYTPYQGTIPKHDTRPLVLPDEKTLQMIDYLALQDLAELAGIEAADEVADYLGLVRLPRQAS